MPLLRQRRSSSLSPSILYRQAPLCGAANNRVPTMKRREFLAILGAAVAVPRVSAAQTPARTYHLGTLDPVFPMTEATPFGKTLVKALSEHGYVIGQNLPLDSRGAMGDVAKIPSLLGELKAGGADAIIIVGYPTALAAKSLGIPTVAALGLGDPVETGLIASLAHPGGNITGISDVAAMLCTKRLSLLQDLSPKLQRVAMLWNKDDRGMTLRCEASADAARSIAIPVQAVAVREPPDFNKSSSTINQDIPPPLLTIPDPLPTSNQHRSFEL